MTPDGAARRVELPLGTTAAVFRPESMDPAARTVELVWTTGARVQRVGWDGNPWLEELAVSDEAIDFARLRNGANLLAAHNASGLDGILGVVEDARLEDYGTTRQGVARVRFSSRPDVEPIFRDVLDGVIRNVSVGYIVHRLEEIETGNPTRGEWPVYRATQWEPVEVSLVAVPADAGATVRSDERTRYPCLVSRRTPPMATTILTPPTLSERNPDRPVDERPPASPLPTGIPDHAQPPDAPADAEADADPSAPADEDATSRATLAERARIQSIRRSVRVSSLPGDVADTLIDAGVSAAEAPGRIIAELARRQPRVSRDALDVGSTGAERLGDAISNTLLNRLNPVGHALTPEGRNWQGFSLLELGRAVLEARGVRTRGLARQELAAVALGLTPPTTREGPHGFHTTSDFAAILANVGRITLGQGYALSPRTFPPWTRQTTLPDFRTAHRVPLGFAPRLVEVPEHAEYTRGTLSGMNTLAPIKLTTFGRILAFTRQAMVNDDLGLFLRIPQMFGASAAQVEGDAVYSVLQSTAPLADGTPLFDVSRGNLVTPGTAITLQSITQMREALMSHTTPDGAALVITPRFLVCGPKQELYAYQFTSSAYMPTGFEQVVPPQFRSLEVVVDPRIKDLSWYLAASPTQVDTIEYAYLEGAPQGGPSLETRTGWDVDGIEFKAREDFGAAAIDWRGLVKNLGAAPAVAGAPLSGGSLADGPTSDSSLTGDPVTKARR
jgi:hypothetical protein